jgi:predicted Zn-dependent peptidase
MESWGGHNNGTTSNDRTNYYEIGPTNLLETCLWLEADRLATLAEVITDEELERQRKVVQNERRQSYENRPYGQSELVIPDAMYPADHPYHWPTIGSHADLEAAGLQDVRDFFTRFYLPSNASLVVAGDFDFDSGRALVEKYFGWIPKRPAPPRRTPPPAALPRNQEMVLTDRVQLPRLRLCWHSPALFAKGDADLDLASQILGGGKSSRLYKSLVFERRLAQDAFAYQSSQMLGSLFHVGVTAKPGVTLEQIQRAVDDELARFSADGPTDAEVDRARNSHLADFYTSLDHLQTRADILNHYEHLFGDPDGVDRDLDRYQNADRGTVRAELAATVAGNRLDLRTVPQPDDSPAPDASPEAT